MIKKLIREIYLLPRGEQRALIVLSFLLILSLMLRIGVHFFPVREPAGLEEFTREARALMSAFARSDSLDQAKRDSLRDQGSGTCNFCENQATPSRIFDPPIHINRVDSAGLLPLPGIGPVFAGRIIKYRDLLGGFYCVEQLKEVYGMRDHTVELLSERIRIDSTAIRRIPLESASFRELLRHPYLNLEEVRVLVEYRDFSGNIQSQEELRENHIWSDSTLSRMLPYLEFW